jgi:hypothetical protein
MKNKIDQIMEKYTDIETIPHCKIEEKKIE